MPRFIGKDILKNNDAINKALSKENSSWYANTLQDYELDARGDGLGAHRLHPTLNQSAGQKRVRCLDLTDFDMSDSSLKRFHQVTICGDLVDKPNYNYIITAGLPKAFRYSIGGSWGQPFKSFLNFSDYNGLAQAATSNEYGSSFQLATLSVWESPNPLTIQLELECLDDIAGDTGTNTLEAIHILSRWALPGDVSQLGTYDNIPGPGIPAVAVQYNSFRERDKNDQLTTNKLETPQKRRIQIAESGGNRLSVLIGGMLFMDYCILKQIDVNYPNTKAQYLHTFNNTSMQEDNGGKSGGGLRLLPARCIITLTLQTAMGLTRTNFAKMLSLIDTDHSAKDIDLTISNSQTLGTIGDQFKSTAV